MNSFSLYLAGGQAIEAKRTLVMGILNATPDSFSDGGELENEAVIKKRVQEMIQSGADILDVGGESTRPGHQKVSEKEELGRILPVIGVIRNVSKTIPISVDTQKASVAKAALQAGASMINDVSALSDRKMANVINDFGCSVILMRNKPTGQDVIKGCKEQFEKIVKKAEKEGVGKNKILLDPGLGFGDLKKADYKTSPGSDPAANILLILGLQKYSLGLPVVIGASRKRFLGDITGVEKAKDRLTGSIAAAIMAQQAGAAIVRVHDVAETIQAFKNLS